MYYFAADMHLGNGSTEESRLREQRVVEWLNSIATDAREIFFVGDTFDFWYEYRRVVPRGHSRLFGTLAQLADRGVKIHFFAGNHDIWMGDYFKEEFGAEIHHGAYQTEIAGKKVWIEHGDRIYNHFLRGSRILGAIFRNRLARWLFTHFVHPNTALRFGLAWADHSRKSKEISHPFRGEDDFMVRWTRSHTSTPEAADYYILGHSHCAEDYPLGEGRRLVMLGHWFGGSTWAKIDSEGNISLIKH